MKKNVGRLSQEQFLAMVLKSLGYEVTAGKVRDVLLETMGDWSTNDWKAWSLRIFGDVQEKKRIKPIFVRRPSSESETTK